MKIDKSMRLIQQWASTILTTKLQFVFKFTDNFRPPFYLPKYFGKFHFITSLYKQRSNFFPICHHVQLSVNSQVDHT